ncbi:MAG: FAD/NAD(P)-binding protein [Vicinamibacterales bacterium]
MTDPMLPTPWQVGTVTRETHDTFTLTLHRSDNNHRGFAPGQFDMLWAFGVGELPISISGDAADVDRLVFTVRSVGSGTQALVRCPPGAMVGVRGPFGNGWPLDAAEGRDLVLVAGGIGLAPLRSVVYDALRRRERYGRLVLVYGARSPRDLIYRRELAAWSKRRDMQVLVTVDYGGLSWRGHVGVVTTVLRQVRLQPDRTVAMVCGPEVMMKFVARELESRGVADHDLFVSMERNMKCAVGFCGHCQLGPHFICKDGPVFPYSTVRRSMDRHEL